MAPSLEERREQRRAENFRALTRHLTPIGDVPEDSRFQIREPSLTWEEIVAFIKRLFKKK